MSNLKLGNGWPFVIDRRYMDNRTYDRPPYRLPEEFRPADTVGSEPQSRVWRRYSPTSFPRGAKPQNCGFRHRGRNLLCNYSRLPLTGFSEHRAIRSGCFYLTSPILLRVILWFCQMDNKKASNLFQTYCFSLAAGGGWYSVFSLSDKVKLEQCGD